MLSPIDATQVRLKDRFWTGWQERLVTRGLPHQYRMLEETGRLENFRRVARGESSGHEGLCFNDSDVHKWLEAAIVAEAVTGGTEDLHRQVVGVIELVQAAQAPDGYLDTYIQLGRDGLRWRNLGALHEMYCMGHFIEAGVAHHRATGQASLLASARRAADRMVADFGPAGQPGFCGHQEVETALLRLAEVVDDGDGYADLARAMIDRRGRRPSPIETQLGDNTALELSPWLSGLLLKSGGGYSGEYLQDHIPLREQSEPAGHAVRAMYFYEAAARAYPSDPAVRTALEKIWESLVSSRLYVTGGVGSSAHNEGFTEPYDLPNFSAYAETCAAVGLVRWAHRMFLITGEGRYLDVMELALYNAALAGISWDTDRYFYANPLESRGHDERQPWFSCACCPPNIARLIASVGGFVAAVGPASLHILLPLAGEFETIVKGVRVKITIESDYPWGGEMQIRVQPDEPVEFSLYLRQPGWHVPFGGTIRLVTGADFDADRGFIRITRTWKPRPRTGTDRLSVDWSVAPTWVACDPRVERNVGRAALVRGPIVYCLEEHDLGGPPGTFSVATGAHLSEAPHEAFPDALGIAVHGWQDVASERLYFPLHRRRRQPRSVQATPYYLWANRGPNAMQVWVRRL